MDGPLVRHHLLAIGLISAMGAVSPGCVPDLDRDGIQDTLDQDTDGDGINDAADGFVDTDGDNVVNARDNDSDGDSLLDLVEANDADADGYADVTPVGADADLDGIDDAYDLDCGAPSDCAGVLGVEPARPDFDGDGTPDYLDTDSDDDGVLDADETGDANQDGVPDYLQHCCLVTIDAPGLVNATFRDLENDGEFDLSTSAGNIVVEARRTDFLNNYWTRRAIIEFDITALPAGSRIVDAKLALRTMSISYGSGFDVELHGYLGDGEITLDDAYAGSNVDASFRVDGALPWLTVDVDVTELLQNLAEQQATIAGINMRASSESATHSTDDEYVFSNLSSTREIYPPPSLTISYTP